MTYQLRTYQKEASKAAVSAFKRGTKNGLLVLPTGAGKSLIVADVASQLDTPLLVFCPSKEILEQNYAKMKAYDIRDMGVYSASVGEKNIRKITLATIGSVMNHLEDFRLFKFVLIDEAHVVNAQGGMYEQFIHDREDRCVVGMTATPFRLGRGTEEGKSMLKFLTRTRPRIFSEVLYCCQVSHLVAKGYLSKVEYFDVSRRISFDLSRVKSNSTGADYDEESLQSEYERSNFYADLENWTMRVLRPKDGSRRHGVLVFTRFVKEAEYLKTRLRMRGVNAAIVCAETPKKERERIIRDFKAGYIKVVCNSGILTTGFDYPALDTIILARPTKSLGLYYQIVGREIRPYQGKKPWLVDLCGAYRRFGRIEDLKIEHPYGSGKWAVTSQGRMLTNVNF